MTTQPTEDQIVASGICGEERSVSERIDFGTQIAQGEP